jgi:hypothetical protein
MRNLFLILVILVTLLSLQRPIDAQDPEIRIGLPVQGELSESSDTQSWQFTADTNGVHAFLANRLDGTLDPTVAVIDAEGEIVGDNDDRLPELVYDAGVAMSLDAGETYTIEVGRFDGSGRYQLWAVPAYQRVWEDEQFSGDITRWEEGKFAYPEDNRLILETDPEFSVFVRSDGIIPLENFYLQAEFEWLSPLSDTAATTGLMFHVDDDGTRRPPGYYFLITPDGTWSFLARGDDEFVVIVEPTPADVLTGERISLGVWANNATYRFYANGELLGEVTDSTFDQGLWGLHVRGALKNARVAVDDLLLTVPDSDIPDFPSSIENWASPQPNEIIAELENILPADGERRYFLPDLNYDVAPLQTSIFSLDPPDTTYTDIVIGTDAFVINGENAACGINLRYLDEANQVVAYIDGDGGASLLHNKSGRLVRNTYEFFEEVEETLAGDRHRILVIALNDVTAMYVDGQRFAVEYIPPIDGTVGITLFNYATSPAACGYENYWIWR